MKMLKDAEVGEKNPSLYYRSLEAATIERCAKVAEQEMAMPWVAERIAAAIRKLKDEP